MAPALPQFRASARRRLAASAIALARQSQRFEGPRTPPVSRIGSPSARRLSNRAREAVPTLPAPPHSPSFAPRLALRSPPLQSCSRGSPNASRAPALPQFRASARRRLAASAIVLARQSQRFQLPRTPPVSRLASPSARRLCNRAREAVPTLRGPPHSPSFAHRLAVGSPPLQSCSRGSPNPSRAPALRKFVCGVLEMAPALPQFPRYALSRARSSIVISQLRAHTARMHAPLFVL